MSEQKKYIKKGYNLKSRLNIKPGIKKFGKDNPNWKGGTTKLVTILRHTKEYYLWRSKIFERDNWTCQTCRKRGGGGLDPHHIIAFSNLIGKYNIKNIEEALNCIDLWNINNGITLCHSCHKLTKNFGRNEENRCQNILE